MKTRTRNGTEGFTLIELMVVVSIIAVLGSLAAPSFQAMLRKNRLTAAAAALQSSLNLARSEAIKRGANARVSVSAKGTADDFIAGWSVYVDKTSNANSDLAPTADSTSVTRLEVISAVSNTLTYGHTGSVKSFSYSGMGRLVDPATGGNANRSVYFSDGVSSKICLIINTSGRVRTEAVASATDCPTT